ncbi:MAG: hypothetical protein H7X71_04845, partial [Chitinophagales bacterium]|nr:hypothetical protein [Chitinophagales bacterium]
QWKRNKTNGDYVFETFGKQFYPQFNNYTLLFEYTWYGERAIEEHQFQFVRQSFTNLIDTINRTSN